jgi:hypothetical protein
MHGHVGVWLLVAGTAIAQAGPAHAAGDVLKVCGAKYQAAKADGRLPAGQSWAQFLAQCRGTVAPAPRSAVAAPGPATAAMHDRQRRCGEQWKADKAANRLPAGQRWPQYWSACSKRLKG